MINPPCICQATSTKATQRSRYCLPYLSPCGALPHWNKPHTHSGRFGAHITIGIGKSCPYLLPCC